MSVNVVTFTPCCAVTMNLAGRCFIAVSFMQLFQLESFPIVVRAGERSGYNGYNVVLVSKA